MRKDFIESRIPQASKSAAFRKITRPNTRTTLAVKAFERTSLKPILVKQTSVISKFNLAEADPGSIRGAKFKTAALGSVNLGSVTTVIDQALSQYNADPKNIAIERLVDLLK